jgi:hypothetical protein
MDDRGRHRQVTVLGHVAASALDPDHQAVLDQGLDRLAHCSSRQAVLLHQARLRGDDAPGRQRARQLADFTVSRQGGGSMKIRFFGELRDPAALQYTLRADGVPASVSPSSASTTRHAGSSGARC